MKAKLQSDKDYYRSVKLQNYHYGNLNTFLKKQSWTFSLIIPELYILM